MEEKYKKELRKLKKQIVENYQPEKIILFGSLAWGKVNEDSDIDLFIVKKTNKKFGKRIDEVYLITNKAKLRVPKDIIVFTPLEVKRQLALGDFFIKNIITNGKVVYAKK